MTIGQHQRQQKSSHTTAMTIKNLRNMPGFQKYAVIQRVPLKNANRSKNPNTQFVINQLQSGVDTRYDPFTFFAVFPGFIDRQDQLIFYQTLASNQTLNEYDRIHFALVSEQIETLSNFSNIISHGDVFNICRNPDLDGLSDMTFDELDNFLKVIGWSISKNSCVAYLAEMIHIGFKFDCNIDKLTFEDVQPLKQSMSCRVVTHDNIAPVYDHHDITTIRPNIGPSRPNHNPRIIDITPIDIMTQSVAELMVFQMPNSSSASASASASASVTSSASNTMPSQMGPIAKRVIKETRDKRPADAIPVLTNMRHLNETNPRKSNRLNNRGFKKGIIEKDYNVIDKLPISGNTRSGNMMTLSLNKRARQSLKASDIEIGRKNQKRKRTNFKFTIKNSKISGIECVELSSALNRELDQKRKQIQEQVQERGQSSSENPNQQKFWVELLQFKFPLKWAEESLFMHTAPLFSISGICKTVNLDDYKVKGAMRQAMSTEFNANVILEHKTTGLKYIIPTNEMIELLKSDNQMGGHCDSPTLIRNHIIWAFATNFPEVNVNTLCHNERDGLYKK